MCAMNRWTPIVVGVGVGVAVGVAAYYLPPRGFAHAAAMGSLDTADRVAVAAFAFRDLIVPLGLLALLILMFGGGSSERPALPSPPPGPPPWLGYL